MQAGGLSKQRIKQKIDAPDMRVRLPVCSYVQSLMGSDIACMIMLVCIHA